MVLIALRVNGKIFLLASKARSYLAMWSPNGGAGSIFTPFYFDIKKSQMGIFGIYVQVCTTSLPICHLNLYQTHIITMAICYIDAPFCKWKYSSILTYIIQNTKYCNYSIIAALNTTILNLLVDVVHIYIVLTFGCHNSLSIDFSRVV